MIQAQVNDIMNYNVWCFCSYIFATVIIGINLLKVAFASSKRYDEVLQDKGSGLDVLISFICLLILVSGIYFQAILSDNSSSDNGNWINTLFVLVVISLVFFITQLVLFIKKN